MNPRMIVNVLAAILIGSATAWAKSGTIEVSITDAVTGASIENALVSLVGSPGSAISDSNGIVSLSSIPAGEYTLKVTHSQYEDYVAANIQVTPNRRTELIIKLTPRKGSTTPNYRSKPGQGSLGHQIDSAAGLTENRGETKSLLKQSRKIVVADAPATQSMPSPDSYSDAQDQSSRSAEAPYFDKISPTRRDRLYTEPQLPPFDMFFRDYGTHGFVDTRSDNQSTFGLDVDDASYTLVRRYLTEGNVPPAEAIRVEEFINHFNYGYNTPTDGTFRIFSELAPSPFRNGVYMLKLGVKAREVSDWKRKPVRLVLVIDESGSMGYDNRLQLVKRSVEVLAGQLDRADRVAIVAYRNDARIVLRWTSGDRIDEIMRAMSRIYPGGSTNVADGLEIAYRMAAEQFSPDLVNRIVLFSDGVANVGPTSAESIMESVGDQARRGILLSTFGVGMGNYNDVLLEQLATKGNGRYAYLNDLDEADKQLADQFTSAMQVVARDAKIQVTFDPREVSAYRLIGYENRDIADNKFRDRRQDGGEIGSGHEVTALYEVVLNRKARGEALGQVALRWNDVDRHAVVEINRDISLSDGSRSYQRVRPELKLAMVAAEFALALKGSDYSTVHLAEISREAKAVARELPSDETRELADLVARADQLMSYHTDYDDGDGYRSDDGRNYKH